MLIGYIVQTCCNSDCGISFAVPARWDEIKRNDHTWMFCPNGHRQRYLEESSEQRLTRELAQAKSNAEWFQKRLDNERDEHVHTKNRLNATKGIVTRTKKRVAHGVCVCCTRTFSNLAMHMEKQHPEYVKEAKKS